VRVFLFDLELLTVEVLQAPPRPVPPRLNRFHPQLQRLAQRALYVLGLHAGSVDILIEGISREPSAAHLTLLGANAGPPLSARAADRLAQSLQRTHEAVHRRNHLRHPVVLEAEAEFVLASAKRFEKALRPHAPESRAPARKPRREGV